MNLLGALLLFLSATCGLGFLWQWKESNSFQSRAQPTTAKILANRIRTEAVASSKDQLVSKYQAELLLEYQFNGQSFRKWIADPTHSTQRSRIEILLGHRCPGTQIAILLDHKHPQVISFPSQGQHKSQTSALLAILSICFAISGLLLIRLSHQNQHNKGEVVYLS
jgi:hypothetical protein